MTVAAKLEDFARAETDRYLERAIAKSGLGMLWKDRRPLTTDDQVIIRMNYGVMYAIGVFDLTTPVTLTLPKSDRYLSMCAINQDHYLKVLTIDPGEYTLTIDDIGTRYVWVMYRILVNANDEDDITEVNRLQDLITSEQTDPGSLEIPDWNDEHLGEIRSHLLALGRFSGGSDGLFGDVDEVDPIRHLFGTAYGWGGLPEHHVMYTGWAPPFDDELAPYALTVGDVRVDAFWSVTVYNADGYVNANDTGVCSINDGTADKNADGTITIRFGGDATAPNHLAISPGWSYLVRLYLPRADALDKSWRFPLPTPASS